MSLFSYSPIDLTTSAFRLICLIECHPCPEIHCELLKATFGEESGGMTYGALSYTWGTSENSAEILVNNQVLDVAWNLYDALYHLRLSEKDRYLWVDTVCIDQSNNEERGHQVRLMGSIYQEANSVLIWLGCSREQTNCLFDIFAQRNHNAFDELSSSQASQLEILLQRPWFSRVWILQEIGNARTAFIVCGWDSISARTFAESQRIVSKLLLPMLGGTYKSP